MYFFKNPLPRQAGEISKSTAYLLIFSFLSILYTSNAWALTASAEILTSDERKWLIQNQSRLVLAVETGYAPFVFIDEQDQPGGLAHDYMRLIEAKLGVHFKQQRFATLEEIFQAVRSDKVHIVNAVTSTPARAKFLQMTAPFVSVPNVIIQRKDNDEQISEQQLAGLKVALVKSYAITEYLENQNLVSAPDLVSDDLSALLNVSFSRSDAAVIDLATASYLISKKGITNLNVAGEVAYDVRLSIGTPKSEPVLQRILEKGLAAITDAERQEIKGRWISAAQHQSIYKDREFWITLGSVLAVVLVIFIIFIIWNRTLHRQIVLRKKIADELRLERDQNQRYLDTTLALMVELDREGKIIMINHSASKLLGYAENELLGENWFTVCLPQPHGMAVIYPMFCKLLEGDSFSTDEFENLIQCRDGSQRMIAWRNTLITDDAGKVLGILSSGADITERTEHQKQLEHIAHYDALTGLPNRVMLADRLHQGMIQAQRRGQRLAVAYLDLDGFKIVNDNYGHDVGDQLLMVVATHMKQALREGDTLARIGGDEFVAVLLDLNDIESSVPMLNRLLAAAAQEVEIEGRALQVSASLGVTFYPQNESVDADQLLRQADQAMYQAKLAGKNRYHVFDSAQDSIIRGHHESLERIRRALIEREFVLHYQPKVNMRSGTVIGAEALIRWQHPQRGLLAPGVFLPVIEDHPLAVEIGEWVIDTALSQLEIWHSAGLEISISINVGAFQLQHPNFVESLRVILAAHPKVNASYLEIEVLETSALEDITQVTKVMDACREIGISFALDDFGTGYSSLTYLKRLPVSLLKIDQSFVSDMLENPEDLAILEGVIGLAAAFRREVIAEGVETIASGEMLLLLGCELAQGFGIARPMPGSEMLAWTLAWHPDVTWAENQSISRDDLPLLFAGVEHRAWISGIEAFLKGKRETSPPINPHQCRFGQWLDSGGLARHGGQDAVSSIKALHEQIHAHAKNMLHLQSVNRGVEALAGLDELYRQQDNLLVQLNKLVRREVD